LKAILKEKDSWTTKLENSSRKFGVEHSLRLISRIQKSLGIMYAKPLPVRPTESLKTPKK
jgi:transposase